MREVIKRIRDAIVIMVILFLYGCSIGTTTDIAGMIEDTAKSIQKISGSHNILAQKELMQPGNSSSDWIAIALALSKEEHRDEDYLKELVAYVGEKYEAQGYLHKVKATEYHRIALTMLALGGDPAKIEYKGRIINLIQDGTYGFHGGSPGLQGANGLIYALLVLDSVNYQIPETARYNREELLRELLSYQKEDGGFCLDPSLESDIDITAMALQALAPYKEQEKISNRVEKALLWLAQQMTEEGTFTSYGRENAESCAQVVLALCALEIDPLENKMFQKQKNAIEGLNSFRQKNGMYLHIKESDKEDLMATYQSLLALEAVEAFQTKKEWIFNFREDGTQ